MSSSAELRLARVLEWLWDSAIPLAVEKKARELLVDTIACALAAAAKPPLKALSEALVATDSGEVSVPGFAGRFSVPGAGALFAAAACWDEACEGLARAHGRPGVPIIAALLALRHRQAASLEETLSALVTGYEVGGRLGEALSVPVGGHVDATWPGLGVAAAVVRLCGGTPAPALSAVRIAACQMPHSLYLPVKSGAETRNTYLAHSVQLGLLAAQAALARFTVPERVLDELGARQFAAPGEWLTLEAYLKPFAAVRHVHYAAAAALKLRANATARLETISRIELSTYAEALRYCGNRGPQTPIQAQFSLSYGAACALARGELTPEAYEPSVLQDRLVRDLEAKVVLSEDPALTRAGKRGARLAVFAPGARWESAVEEIEGDPSRPMPQSAIVAKFERYARRPAHAAAAFFAADTKARFASVVEELVSPR